MAGRVEVEVMYVTKTDPSKRVDETAETITVGGGVDKLTTTGPVGYVG